MTQVVATEPNAVPAFPPGNLAIGHAKIRAVYEQFVTAPYPARTTVGSFLGDFLVEVDVVAALP